MNSINQYVTAYNEVQSQLEQVRNILECQVLDAIPAADPAMERMVELVIKISAATKEAIEWAQECTTTTLTKKFMKIQYAKAAVAAWNWLRDNPLEVNAQIIYRPSTMEFTWESAWTQHHPDDDARFVRTINPYEFIPEVDDLLVIYSVLNDPETDDTIEDFMNRDLE